MSEPLSGRIVDDDSGPGGSGGSGGSGGGAGPGPGSTPGLPARWARAWIVPVGFGAVSIVLGLLVLFWPGHTVGTLTTLFGLYLLITGGYRFIAAIQLKGIEPVARVVALVMAALSVAIGLVCLVDPFSTAAAFAMVAGVFWLAAGAIAIFGARQRRGHPIVGRGPGVAGGVFSMIIGLLVLTFPNASLVVLAWILGCSLIFFGISALATGLAARRLLKNVARAALYWP